jgi:hypothetical protein
MTTKAAEKIIEGLSQLMQGFYELRQSVREDLGATVEAEEEEEEADSGDPELEAEVEAAVANELRAALETVLEGDEYSSEDLAHMISGLTEALEEVDPDVFAEETEAADDDLDDDDYDYDEDDDEDFDELEEDEDDIKEEE